MKYYFTLCLVLSIIPFVGYPQNDSSILEPFMPTNSFEPNNKNEASYEYSYNGQKGIHIELLNNGTALQKKYNDDGQLISITHGYLSLQTDTSFHLNNDVTGSKIVIQSSVKFIKNGLSKEWDPNGKLIAEGQYLVGQRIGLWKEYNDKTKEFNEKIYD